LPKYSVLGYPYSSLKLRIDTPLALSESGKKICVVK